MVENKVTYGLKNAHYAVVTVGSDGSYSYSTPVPLPGSVELSFDPQGDLIKLYADNAIYYMSQNNQGYSGTLTMANIPEQFLIDCLGEEKDETDLVLTEKATAHSTPFALMFEFDGDQMAVRHVMYNCAANRPKFGSSTRTDKAEPNTNELTFSAGGRPKDGIVKTRTTVDTPSAIYDAWYTAVYEKTVV